MAGEKNKKPLVGVIVGKASTADKAQSIAGFLSTCPYCATCVNVGSALIGVLSVPQDHRWWLDSIPEHPRETMGLETAQLFYADKIEVASPWSSTSVKPNLDQPPCGADCKGCPMYRHSCKGCPATTYYVSSMS